MLEFRLNNQTLLTSPGGGTEFHFPNAALENDFISGSYILPFTFPNDKGGVNARIFKFSNKIETRKKQRIYDGLQVLYNKTLKCVGKIVLTRSSAEGFVCSVSVNGFAIDALDKSLKDVNYGDDVILGSVTQDVIDHANDTVTQTYPDVNYNFPEIKNENFYGGSNTQFSGYVNGWSPIAQTFRANYIEEADEIEDSVINQECLSPQLFHLFVLNKAFESLGYRLIGSFKEHPEFLKALLYNNYALDEKKRQYDALVSLTAPQSFNAGGVGMMAPGIIEFDDDSTDPNHDDEGAYDTASFEYDGINGFIQVSVDLHLEFEELYLLGTIRIIVFINGVWVDDAAFPHSGSSLDISYTFPAYYKPAGQALTVRVWYDTIGGQTQFDPFTVEGSCEFINKSFELLNSYANVIHYANHVPDKTISEYLYSLRLLHNTVFVFDNKTKTVSIDFSEEILDGKIVDWTSKALIGPERVPEIQHEEKEGFVFSFVFDNDELASENFIDVSDRNNIGEFNTVDDLPAAETEGDIALVLNVNNIYTAKMTDSILKWEFLCDNFYDYIYDPENTNNRKEIQPKIAPMLMRYNEVTGVEWILPAIKHAGNSTAFDIGIDNDCPLRSFFWQGLQPNSEGDDYPFGSSQNRNYDGDVVGNLTLRWDDEDYGLFVTFWQRWARFWYYKEKVLMPLDMEETHVQAYSHKNRYRVRDSIYLVKELKALYGQILEKSEAEIWKINTP